MAQIRDVLHPWKLSLSTSWFWLFDGTIGCEIREIQSLSFNLKQSALYLRDSVSLSLFNFDGPNLGGASSMLHPYKLFLYKWALEIARKGKSCRSFFVLGATTGCDSYCSPQSTGNDHKEWNHPTQLHRWKN
ncbi:uncharacterized protein LOC131019887 [Salvia miltiorrhiza]|uniref:uncharacterized protein LOC131019887 n=1 Tax=Salvia miltiorrhiza TaxID=226208 RepID=UPI0025AD71A4|nr:uncharacterized protein LOC131019887 [Salvia miltiorrhiza]